MAVQSQRSLCIDFLDHSSRVRTQIGRWSSTYAVAIYDARKENTENLRQKYRITPVANVNLACDVSTERADFFPCGIRAEVATVVLF